MANPKLIAFYFLQASLPLLFSQNLQGATDLSNVENQFLCAQKLVSRFENDSDAPRYDYCETLRDGRGYTCGFIGMTSQNGELLQFVDFYTNTYKNKNAFVSAKGNKQTLRNALEMAKGSESTKGLKPELPRAFAEEAKDSRFAQAQKEFARKNYFLPVVEAANKLGLKSPLTRIALFEAAIQHGAELERSEEELKNGEDVGVGCIIRLINKKAGTPQALGEEKWLEEFLKMRKSILDHAGEKIPADPENPKDPESWPTYLDEKGEIIRLSPDLSPAKRKLLIEKYGAKHGELQCIDDGSALEWFKSRDRATVMLGLFQKNRLNLDEKQVILDSKDWKNIRVKECENLVPKKRPPTTTQ